MLADSCKAIETEEPVSNQEIFTDFGLLSGHPWQHVANSQITNYYNCLYKIVLKEKPKSILEIGTAFGLSTATILKASIEPDLFISLDLGIIGDQTGFSQNNIEYVRDRVHAWCCRRGLPLQRVRFYRANSQPEGIGDNANSGSDIVRWHRIPELVRLLQGHEFDVIFIDGKHTDNGLWNDLETFWPFLRDGGLIICDDLHDGNTYKGVFDWAGQTLASYEKFKQAYEAEIADSFIWNHPRVPPADFRGLRPFGLIRKKRDGPSLPARPEFAVFDTPDALRINHARLDHLASLGLDLVQKSVLEVGSGVGWHTGFFEKLGCQVISTDARPENATEHIRRYPWRAKRVEVADLNFSGSHDRFGKFDIVYCYGTLYHLKDPALALHELAPHCSGLLLVETCVNPFDNGQVNPEKEDPVWKNQSIDGTGNRPGRDWIMKELKNHFPFVFISRYQPRHPEFPTKWPAIQAEEKNTRAVFVASRFPSALPTLSPDLLSEQMTIGEIVWAGVADTRAVQGPISQSRQRLSSFFKRIEPVMFLPLFEKSHRELINALEKNLYGGPVEEPLIFKENGGILFSPTDARDHFVTPFFEPAPAGSRGPCHIRITLSFPRDQPPGKNCVVHLQDSQFNQISVDVDFSSPLCEERGPCRIVQTVNLGNTCRRFRLIIATSDGKPTFIPVMVRIEQSTTVSDRLSHGFAGRRSFIASLLGKERGGEEREVYSHGGNDLFSNLETIIYDKQTSPVLQVVEGSLLFSPTSVKDHVATPFIELEEGIEGSKREAMITLSSQTGKPPGRNCVMYIQDERYDAILTLDFAFVPPGEENQRLSFPIGPKISRLRVVFTTKDGRPTNLPSSVSIVLLDTSTIP